MRDIQKGGSHAKADQGASDAASGPDPGRATLTEDLAGTLQMHGGGGAGSQAAGAPEIAASGFSGSPSAVPYRAEMESGFGANFSGVQAYHGGAAAEANSQLGSEAYAVGQKVAFKSDSPSKEVVAHELAHTIQQSGGAGPVQTWSVGSPGDSYEQEADAAAATVLAGGQATVASRTSATVARWGGSDHYTIGNTAGQKAIGILNKMGIKDPGVATVKVKQGGGVLNEDKNKKSQSGSATPGTGMTGSGTGMTASKDNTTLGVTTSSGSTMSFGAASRASGDYAGTPEELDKRKSELEGAGAGLAGDSSKKGVALNAIQFAQMTKGGMTNSNHFYPQNGMEYRQHHKNALDLAKQAHDLGEAGNQAGAQAALDKAMEEEGFGSHFLQDTHSSGHQVPRALDDLGALHGDRSALANALSKKATGVNNAVGNATGKAGGMVGSVEGRLGALGHQIGNLQNPFSHASSQQRDQAAAQQGAATQQSWQQSGTNAAASVTSTAQPGGMLNKVVTSADHLVGFTQDAYQGLVRSKQWHDFFCALPNGLDLDDGKYHGDYFMDGNDLERVSNKAANSIVQVLAAAQGQGGGAEGYTPHPDVGKILADPMAGPVWKLMMSDYAADLAKAKEEIQANDHGQTDGKTPFSSMEVLKDLEANTFGEGLPPQNETKPGDAATNLAVLDEKRTALKGIVDDLNHFLSTEFGYNQNMGAHGLDDNLNAPKKPGQSGDAVGDGTTGASFDPCQLECKYQLFTMLGKAALEYQGALAAGQANPHLPADKQKNIKAELGFATDLMGKAQAWKTHTAQLVAAGKFAPGAGDARWGAYLGVSGEAAQNVAWGAGHPEFITNHGEREVWRNKELIPAFQVIMPIINQHITFGAAAAGAVSTSAASRGGKK